MPVIECQRCGLRWDSNVSNRNNHICSSCRARKSKTVNGTMGKCFPWHGDFAEDEVTPVDAEGVAILPGTRKCGKQDCVNSEHIERVL